MSPLPATSQVGFIMKSGCLAVFLVLCLSAAAQTPYLVRDINTTRSFDTKSSSPAGFAAFGDKVVFAATTAAAGTELWTTDGTPAGTSMVADIVPGPGSSNPVNFRALPNGLVVFAARDANHGNELWVSDGTTAGTHLLFDVSPGPSSSDPIPLLFGNQIFFSADDGVHGRELWTTDGTASGTRLVKDLDPGSASGFRFGLVKMGNFVYFAAVGGLWKTDGTDAGTVRVSSGTLSLNAISTNGSLLFLEAWTPEAANELWISDGTAAGTRLLMDILPGPNDSFGEFELGFMIAGSRALFVANDGVHGRELWVTDGTVTGTHMVADLTPGSKGTWDDDEYAAMRAIGDRVLFAASDAEHGKELWTSDGTEAGTSLLDDVRPGPGSSSPRLLAAAGGKVYFTTGSDPLLGALLWVSDGTAAGTHAVTSGGARIGATTVSAVNGKAYFAGVELLSGTEPWVSDGTDAGTHLIANIESDAAPSSLPTALTATSSLLFFYAYDGSPANVYGRQLWRSDGTAAGTFEIGEAGQRSPDLRPIGPSLLYSVDPPNGGPSLLMFTDGTAAGTQSADVFLRRFGGNPVSSFFSFGDKVFASVSDGGTNSLWLTTAAPNAAATRLGASDPSNLVEFGGRYAFFTETHIREFGLWTTDGTAAGTSPVYPNFGYSDAGPGPIAYAGGRLFFVHGLSQQPAKLWTSDGTLDGTVALKDVAFSGFADTVDVQPAGGKAFFTAPDALWVTDGTLAGTVEVAKVTFFDSYRKMGSLYSAGDRIVFVQKNGPALDVWGSDGTPAGTKFLAKLDPTAPALASIGSAVYFNGIDDLHGSELWVTDGTPEGTKMVADVNPGAASSSPASFVRLKDTLYFSAYHDLYGRELFAMQFPPQLAIGDVHAPEGNSGSSVVSLQVTLSRPATSTVTVNYATSDGTARAESDYVSTSGTVSFAPGETVKTVDVRINGDHEPEGNETFFVKLRSATGATVDRGEAAVIIDDDDALADLSVAAELVPGSSNIYDGARVTSNGPRGATNVTVTITSTPEYGRAVCTVCPIPQLLAGASGSTAADYVPPFQQTYLSAIAAAKEADPQPANNAASWTLNRSRTVAVAPAFLTPGATATLTTMAPAGATVTSSDPSVIAVSSLTTLANSVYTATLTGLKEGTSTITVTQSEPLTLSVVASGSHPRWPGALVGGPQFSSTTFDRPLEISMTAAGVAPLTGARATGTIVITIQNREVARVAVNGANVTIPVYLTALGGNDVTVAYGGDANFLPQTTTFPTFASRGDATMTGAFEPAAQPGSYQLTVQAAGSPARPPTGSVGVLNGSTLVASLQLTPGANGVSTAQAMLTNIPASATLTLSYGGDTYYSAGNQQLRVVTPRRRSVLH
jgi:ELWxxDGT repeat protein